MAAAVDAPERDATGRLTDRASVVLFLATLTAALTGPGQTIGVSVFIDRFVEDLSLSRSAVSGAYLVGTLTGAALLPSVGRFIDRRGVRLTQVIVGVLFSLALVNMAFVNGIVWLAVGFIGIRFLGQGSLSLVSTVTVSLRFEKNRGSAIGFFSTGSSMLMATVPLALKLLIDAFSWRTTWLIAAAIVLLTVVPIAFFGLVGMSRGSSAATLPATRVDLPRGRTDRSFDRSEAMRTRAFWLLASMTGSAGMLSTALTFHQIDLLGDAGLSDTAAAALFLPQVIGSMLAGLGVGILADRVGSRYLPAAGMALLVVAHLLASVARPGVIVFIYAVVLGAMGGSVQTIAATLLPNWFGTEHLGSIQGSLTFFNVGASALGPFALAVVQGWFGSYPPAVLVLAIIPFGAMLFGFVPLPAIRSMEATDA